MADRARTMACIVAAWVLILAGAAACTPVQGAEAARPNVVLILADDIGYGDLGCYGATKVRTPHCDRLAREGVRFTDAHSTASVCTPTRYAMLTGQYAWRNPAGSGILSGVAPLSIEPGTTTAASLLRRAGYVTGLVGKWHLGLGRGDLDYNQDIRPGPLEVGFDQAFFIPATGDRTPCVYVEDHRVKGLDPNDPIRVSYGQPIEGEPTGLDRPDRLKMKADRSHSQAIVNGISRIGYMAGGRTARWVDEDMADTLAARAVGFVEQHKDRPFFLYFATHDIHEPMVPNARFKGTSGCGSRGDVIHQFDWQVGQVLEALDRLGLTERTIVLLSSDNGGAIKDTYDDGTNALHSRQAPNGALRGFKSMLYEGGHRVPFIARWPGHIQPGSRCDDLVGLVDMPATFAALTGQTLAPDACPDSFSVLPALLGQTQGRPVRDHMVLQNNGTGQQALRKGPWKYIPANETGKKKARPQAQLYDLAKDLAESDNLAESQPDRVREMDSLLEQIRQAGGTRPGR